MIKYDSIYKLPEDDGKTILTPIAQLLQDLEDDVEITDKEKAKYALNLANQLNCKVVGITSCNKTIQDKYDHVCFVILNHDVGKDALRKCKEYIFGQRLKIK